MTTEQRQAIEQVRDQLEAWADHAAAQLRRALPEDETPFRNQRDNYGALVAKLNLALGVA